MLNIVSLLTPIYITLFWAIVLFTNSSRKSLPKFVLGVFMSTAFLLYLSHFFYFTHQVSSYRYFDSIYVLCNLSVFPLYHIYVRILTVDSSISFRKHSKYFVLPFGIFLLYLLGHSLMTNEEAEQYISKVLTENANGKGILLYMKILFFSGRVIFFSQIVYYLVVNFQLISKNNDRLKEFYSNTENRRLNWDQICNYLFAAASCASLVFAVLGRNIFLKSEILLIIPSSFFSILHFSIGLLGNRQQTEQTFQNHVPLTLEAEKNPIAFDTQTAILQGRIIDLFEREMIYKNPDLNIWDLCSRLNTNRTYVSKFINSIYGQNFNQFVNSYRVKHVKVLIESKQKFNNEQLAELSGFGSVNSLYRAFQTIEGVSLSNFRTQKNIQ